MLTTECCRPTSSKEQQARKTKVSTKLGAHHTSGVGRILRLRTILAHPGGGPNAHGRAGSCRGRADLLDGLRPLPILPDRRTEELQLRNDDFRQLPRATPGDRDQAGHVGRAQKRRTQGRDRCAVRGTRDALRLAKTTRFQNITASD